MTSIHDDDPGSRSDCALARDPAACLLPSERERLEQRKDELETVLAAGRIGYCRLRAAGAVLAANSQFKAEWGWPPDEALCWNAVESRVATEDRGRFSEAVRQALAGASLLDLTVRVRPGQADAGSRWLALRGCLVRCGDDADTADLVITSHNVTNERRASEGVLSEDARLLECERQLRAAAEAANRAKDEFLSVISHELRSPLNAILGWNRILTLKCGSDPEVTAITPRIEQSAKAQLKMVNDLLDLGRVSTGKLKVESRPMDLARVARLAIDVARPAAAAKGIEITTRLAPGAGALRADPDRLQQVIGNLLSNAVKFTASGGRITVALREDGAATELTVADTGQGIAPELLPHIFDRFRQGDNSSTRQVSGLGLGLTLVREIVALHGGSVSAYSAGSGTGAIFTVRIPTVRSLSGAPVKPDLTEDDVPERRQTLSGLSILVVDDELEARSVVAEMLQLGGASVTITDSAPAALRQLQAHGAHFDIVVSDIGMPVEDGYSLVRKLRSSQAGRRMLAIAVTGYASRSDVAAAIDAGFDLHVPKPVDFGTFVPLVRRLATWRHWAETPRESKP
ncbi:MAG TPA: hybrid sensor histidine kinase/response regulator [Steroidobacteraceae bacterium]|nr:hybrid sensor histidine kinase/response regulator [Steroidobacteraceae bacterium]